MNEAFPPKKPQIALPAHLMELEVQMESCGQISR